MYHHPAGPAPTVMGGHVVQTQRTLHALVGVAIALSAILTGLAFALSYAHLQSIADTNGLPVEWRSWMWPATVDLFIVIGDVLTVAALLSGRPPLRGLLVTSGGTLASIAVNVSGVGAHRPAMEYVIAAVPPVAAQVAFSVIMWQLHELISRATPVTTPDQADDQSVYRDETHMTTPEQPGQTTPTSLDDHRALTLTDGLLTTQQVMDMIGKSRVTIGRYNRDGKLVPVRTGPNGVNYYHPDHVAAFTA